MPVAAAEASTAARSIAGVSTAARTRRARRRSIAQLRATRTIHGSGPPICASYLLRSRPHPDERLLQDFLRLPAIADDAQDETEEQPAVTIVQLRQCGGIARGDALQET